MKQEEERKMRTRYGIIIAVMAVVIPILAMAGKESQLESQAAASAVASRHRRYDRHALHLLGIVFHLVFRHKDWFSAIITQNVAVDILRGDQVPPHNIPEHRICDS